MTLLLMFDLDARFVSVVTRAMRASAVEVVGAQSLEHAYECAALHPFDAALLDGDVLAPDELEAFAPLPLILTTSFVEPSNTSRRWCEGRVLHKPFTSGQLLSALHDTLGSERSESTSVVDALRRAHTSGRNVALRVGNGEIFIEAGELVHAEWGGMHGETALAQMLREAHPVVARIGERAVDRTIHKPFRTLLFDLLRFIEEGERFVEGDEGRPHRLSHRPSPKLRLLRGGSGS